MEIFNQIIISLFRLLHLHVPSVVILITTVIQTGSLNLYRKVFFYFIPCSILSHGEESEEDKEGVEILVSDY